MNNLGGLGGAPSGGGSSYDPNDANVKWVSTYTLCPVPVHVVD
jgi:hypothetical protein